MTVHPLIFEPIYKPKIWGGDLIFTHFGRAKPMPEPIGESWELADLEEDQSRVRWGPVLGRTLGALRADWGTDLLGQVGLFEGRFPLLIKFLDAQTNLSVQVHPTEAVARRLGGNVRVKNEAWYILAAQPGGAIYHGLEPGTSAETFRQAMLTGQVDGVLRKIHVQPGECYYLPSGTTHALGAGVLVAEIQTPSDITYRTYDWGRVDPTTDRPRDLHLDRAMECITFEADPPPPIQPRERLTPGTATLTRLVACESFVIEEIVSAAGTALPIDGQEPVVWIVLKGTGVIQYPPQDAPLAFGKGDVILLPAALSDATARATTDVKGLQVTVPH